MAGLLDQVQQGWGDSAPAPAQDTAPGNLTAEVQAGWGDPAPSGLAIFGQPRRSVVEDWVRANPQAVTDFLLQAVGTTAGTVAGAPGGPAGMMAGGAGGNLAGKVAARKIGQTLGFEGSEDPSLGEGAVDAAVGAFGPAVSTAARPLAKALAKPLIGATESRVAKQVERFDRIKNFNAQEGSELARANPARETLQRVQNAADEAAKEVSSEASATSVGKRASQLGGFAAAATLFMHGDVLGALGYFGAGKAISAGQKAAARTLMQSEPFLRYLAGSGPSLSTRAQIADSLSLLSGQAGVQAGLSKQDRDAAGALSGVFSSSVVKTAAGTLHDARGRFVSPAVASPSSRRSPIIDHTGHPALEEEDQ
jgi:hypothetical protein